MATVGAPASSIELERRSSDKSVWFWPRDEASCVAPSEPIRLPPRCSSVMLLLLFSARPSAAAPASPISLKRRLRERSPHAICSAAPIAIAPWHLRRLHCRSSTRKLVCVASCSASCEAAESPISLPLRSSCLKVPLERRGRSLAKLSSPILVPRMLSLSRDSSLATAVASISVEPRGNCTSLKSISRSAGEDSNARVRQTAPFSDCHEQRHTVRRSAL